MEIFACPFCQGQGNSSGKVNLRKNSRGYVLSCSNYSGSERCAYTIWLPRASQNVTVPEGDESVCRSCSTAGPVRKVSFTWKPGSVPPHLGRSSTVCVLCDAAFRNDLQMSLPQPNQVRTNARRPQGGGVRRGGAGRGGAGRGAVLPNNRNNGPNNRPNNNIQGNVCFRCGQPGHYANNCPQNGDR